MPAAHLHSRSTSNQPARCDQPLSYLIDHGPPCTERENRNPNSLPVDRSAHTDIGPGKHKPLARPGARHTGTLPRRHSNIAGQRCVADAFPLTTYGVSARSSPRRCHPILVPDPFERSTVRIGPGYRTAIHRHQELARCRGDPATIRHFGEDPGRLIGDPIRTERRDPFGEGLPFRSPRHIGQDRRMEDDKRGILWSRAVRGRLPASRPSRSGAGEPRRF